MPHTYEFTTDWFTNNLDVWKRELTKYQNKPINFLEVGTYEGRSALWALDNVLLHPKSKMYCVDMFQDRRIFSRFLKNAQHYIEIDKLRYFKGSARDMLKTPELLDTKFDLIYIDSSTHSQHVLEQAVLAWPLLKPKGILIFDDYTASKEHDNRCPKPGIDSFLDAYADDLHVMFARWQVFVMKLEKPRHRKRCKSEYYDI